MIKSVRDARTTAASARASRILRAGAISVLACGLGGASRTASSTVTLTSLLSFANDSKGGVPSSPLLAGTSGGLYGTTFGGGANGYGTVFRFLQSPTNPNKWSENVLWSFTDGVDGAMPSGPLVSDVDGRFYGIASVGGANGVGVAYKVIPPATHGGAWTTQTIWAFTRDVDGTLPTSGLVMDSAGALYGSTSRFGPNGYGAVFKLTPPPRGSTAWTETILWGFTDGTDGGNPQGPLTIDSNGNLYGTTSHGGANNLLAGTVYALSPPAGGSGAWALNTLYSFSGPDGGHPYSGVIRDSNSGVLYGTAPFGGTTGQGVAFSLTPPATAGGVWTEATIWQFTPAGGGIYPWAGLTEDANGNLFGVTRGYAAPQIANYPSAVFELSPPTAPSTSWTGTSIASFGADIAWDAILPLTVGADGNLFTMVEQIGEPQQEVLKFNGGIFEISGTAFAPPGATSK